MRDPADVLKEAQRLMREARDQFVFYDERLTIKNHDKELIEGLDLALAALAALEAVPGDWWISPDNARPFLMMRGEEDFYSERGYQPVLVLRARGEGRP